MDISTRIPCLQSLFQTGEFYIWDVKILFSFLFQYKRYHSSQICTKSPAFRGHWPGPATGPVFWTALSDFFLHAPDEPSPFSNYRPTVCLHLTTVYKFSSTSCNKILPYGDETCPCLFRPLPGPRVGLTSSMRLSISVLYLVIAALRFHLGHGTHKTDGSPGPYLRGPRGPGPITKPFIFYFSLMIDAYETTTSLLHIVRHCYS